MGLQTLQLRLSSNALGDDGATAIAKALRETPTLSAMTLAIADNGVTDKGARKLCEALHDLYDLVTLAFKLTDNPLTLSGANMLEAAVKHAADRKGATVVSPAPLSFGFGFLAEEGSERPAAPEPLDPDRNWWMPQPTILYTSVTSQGIRSNVPKVEESGDAV
jgi:hypothetical protein